MSDISLTITPLEILLFALFTGAPGIGIGLVCGALIWRRRRWLGALVGAGLGWAVNWTAFVVWRDGPLSRSLSYWPAIRMGLAHAAPGVVIGAALGAWRWPRARESGAAAGALIGGAASLALWVAITGGP